MPSKGYYQRNKNKVLEKVAKRYQENKDKLRQYAKEYYYKNRQTISAKRKADYKLTRETRLQKAKQWRDKNIEKKRASDAAYRKRSRSARKDAALRRIYGISLLAFQELLRTQEHKCANTKCHRKHSHTKPLVVDHNHLTGRVRGLLCTQCNCAFGYARESREVLMGLIDYGVAHEGEDYQGRPIAINDDVAVTSVSSELTLFDEGFVDNTREAA